MAWACVPGKESPPRISACRARSLCEEGDEPDCWARAVSGWASACGAAGRWVQGRGRVWERGSAGYWAALGAGRARLGSGACCRGSVRRVRGERATLGRAGSGRGEGLGRGLLGWVWVSIFFSRFLF